MNDWLLNRRDPHDADPLLDDKVPCPTCPAVITPDLLCEHDDPDTGPLCVDRCCPYWHDEKSAA